MGANFISTFDEIANNEKASYSLRKDLIDSFYSEVMKSANLSAEQITQVASYTPFPASRATSGRSRNPSFGVRELWNAGLA